MIYWLALICGKQLVEHSVDYVQQKSLTGSDFTLMIPTIPYKDRTEDLNAIYWQWAEKILQNPEEQDIVINKKKDPN